MKPTKLLSGSLRTERLENGRRILLRDLRIAIPEHGITLTVPGGFETDYSSIPQLFAGIVRWSKVDIAGVVHDYLYKVQAVDRKLADKIWRNIARSGEHCANAVQAAVCYRALRVGGWHVWNNYKS